MKVLRFTAVVLFAITALTAGLTAAAAHDRSPVTSSGFEPTPICPYKVCPTLPGN